jgi:hypothetical protein
VGQLAHFGALGDLDLDLVDSVSLLMSSFELSISASMFSSGSYLFLLLSASLFFHQR